MTFSLSVRTRTVVACSKDWISWILRLAYKSSSKFFSSAKRKIEILYVFGGKERARALGPTTATGNEKRRTLDYIPVKSPENQSHVVRNFIQCINLKKSNTSQRNEQ